MKLITDTSGFQSACGDALTTIGSMKPSLDKLGQVISCVANAIIDKMCNTGNSPMLPLNYIIDNLVEFLAKASTIDITINANALYILTNINSVIFQLKQTLNLFQGLINSLDAVMETPFKPWKIVCLKGFYDKMKDLSLLIDIINLVINLAVSVDLNALLNVPLQYIRDLLGNLIPSIMGCSLLAMS